MGARKFDTTGKPTFELDFEIARAIEAADCDQEAVIKALFNCYLYTRQILMDINKTKYPLGESLFSI
ncbi:hypothetical protein RCL_jg13905.t1 [Rhizophagus clarus]|uniref:Uncharacterized protein n=1 Tax=Rhizophagus clarus TaxID=94130 RepID=A0A8H3LSY7_9GLOM|nr:hypothetical protein RCL_jg13905.t1 [Rhizophagus clarus]